jgi:hypothetical protein
MWKVIFDKLKENNLNPYPPGKHEGLCDKPYCVVKEGTQIPSIQSNRLGQKVIDIIVFVPLSSYIALEPYMKQIRAALKEVLDLRKTGFETPAITDDDKKAYTSSIEYVIIKKLEG